MVKILPLIVIVGPTASGKTNLAIKLAKKMNGEIICADSRTIYKYMDIGTAKPIKSEMAEIVHWGLDLVEPDQKFTAKDFKEYAEQKILEIRARGHIPFLVGGSGLYIDSVIFDYSFNSTTDSVIRKMMQDKSIDDLRKYCIENNITLPENDKNKRYLIRAIEAGGKINSSKHELIDNCIVVGITTEKEMLLKKIQLRILKMIDDGVIIEARQLAKRYGWNVESMTSNIYRQSKLLFEGKIDKRFFVDSACLSDKKLVKKQLTWFKRNKFIHWLDVQEAESYILNYVNKK